MVRKLLKIFFETMMRKGDCCTTGGWGKTADNQTQLEEFIKKEQAYKQLNRRYTPFYTTQTALFPTIPRMPCMTNIFLLDFFEQFL